MNKKGKKIAIINIIISICLAALLALIEIAF